MEILHEQSNLPNNVALILGFFDGIHAGHIDVIKNTPNIQKVLVTFSSSPAEYFNKETKYIYSRETNYNLIKNLGVNYIFEQNFADIVHLTAEDYLEKLIKLFNPRSITTGFNHTFGLNRSGNHKFLEKYQGNFEYKYTPPTIIDGEIVSSTKIKEFITNGEIEKANKFLTHNFSIESTVIKGAEIGKKIGFPTANMKYPSNIIKLPYGVYKVKCFDKLAVMNWGIKPTFNTEELLEIHIPNFEKDLYGKNIKVEILSKIRNEKKFDSLDELKKQIKKDIETCLK